MVMVLHEPPLQDGLPKLRMWKRLYPHIPLIVYTSDYSGSATRLLFKSGAEDVIELPSDAEKILSCLEAYFPGFRLKAAHEKKRPWHSAAKSGALLAAVAPGLMFHTPGHMMTTPGLPAAEFPIVQPSEYVFKGLEINFFGYFNVRLNGTKVDLPNQARQILAYLAYQHPAAVTRDRVARTFWPDKYENSPHATRKGLNVEITRIRNAFRRINEEAQDILQFKNGRFGLEGCRWHSDVDDFKAIYHSIQEHLRRKEEVPDELFQRALQIYTGSFLEDFGSNDPDWVETERVHLGSLFERMADKYSEQLCNKGEFWKASGICLEILECDVRMEVIHRRLIDCFYRQGSYDRVEQQYRLCCQMLDREFECPPSPETIRLYEQIMGEWQAKTSKTAPLPLRSTRIS